MSRDAINHQAWQKFQQELAECLSEMDEDDALIISDRYSGAYVQFSGDGYETPMLANAVGNRFLPPDEALSADGYVAMLSLGWFEPDEGNPVSAGNFFLFYNCQGDYLWLAQLAVRTLREVYRINRLSQLQYDCWEPDGTPIVFPTLMIRRKRED